MLEQAIKSAPRYLLATRGETPIQTARNVCEAGFVAMGTDPLELSDESAISAAVAFFPVLYLDTENVQREILEDLGLAGGATGYATLADIKHLDREGASRLFNITFAMVELGAMRDDLLSLEPARAREAA